MEHQTKTWKQILAWPFYIFTEPDGNGGKASFSRVFGGIVIIFILMLAWREKVISEHLMEMFWVLVGYQLLSKALNTLSPAVLEVVRIKMLKITAEPPKSPPPSA